jgi:uncharacterized membrane protein
MSRNAHREEQLNRLTRVVDVVFALVIWRAFMLLPHAGENPAWTSVADMLADEWQVFGVVLLLTLIVIIYWQQHNMITRHLIATDARHSGLAIFQLLFLLLFLYAISQGLQLGASASQRAFESSTAVLVGVLSNLSWRYATRNRKRMIDPEASDEKIDQVSHKILAEPVTALLTIPFAFMGPWFWELSWFLYPLIRKFFSRFRKSA